MRKLPEYLERHALKLVAAAIMAFAIATSPRSIPDVMAVSQVTLTGDASLQLGGRSLLASPPAPDVLNQAIYRHGRFAVELVASPASVDARRAQTLVAYSRAQAFNWSIEQHGTDMVLVHRSRTARFRDVVTAARRQHFVAEFRPDGASLFAAGSRLGDAMWTAQPRPWAPDARLTLGNTETGDYPWTGELGPIRIRSGPPLQSPADRRTAGQPGVTDPQPADLELAVSNAGIGFVGVQDSAPVPLEIHAWPWTLKLRSAFRDSIGNANALDIAANIVLTIPLGLGLAAYLSRRNARRALAVTLATATSISLLVELTQFFSPHRVASIVDIAMNTVGAGIGYYLWMLLSADAED